MVRPQLYTDAVLQAELIRVDALYPDGPLTQARFAAQSSVAAQTLLRRFGSWRQALIEAGLKDRYSGRPVTPKMRTQASRHLSDDDVLAELRRLAKRHGQITRMRVRRSRLISSRTVTARFGSWSQGVASAGLELSAMANRWTDIDLAENLEQLAVHYGRLPTRQEMRQPPSRIQPGTYEHRLGSWEAAMRWFDEQRHGAKT